MSETEIDPFKGTRAWIKDYLIPANALMGLGVSLMAALDLVAPAARPYTAALTVAGAVAAGGLLVAAALTTIFKNFDRSPTEESTGKREKVTAALRRYKLVLWGMFFLTIAGCGSLSLAHGRTGFIASKAPSIAAIQSSLLNLQDKLDSTAVDVKATRANTQLLLEDSRRNAQSTAQVKEGVSTLTRQVEESRQTSAQTSRDTAKILSKLEEPQQAAADACRDLNCAIAMGARRSVIEKMLADGDRLPSALGPALRILIRERNPNRFDIIDLYVATRTLDTVDAKAARVLWSGGLEDGAVRAGAPDVVGKPNCMMATLRPLELAKLMRDSELEAWLLKRGADPSLPNQWCPDLKNSPTFEAGSLAVAR
ncbi:MULTISPECIES: hypothetical protein [Ramlibacter]|uniref:Uncharacterized protein n=1 Tax=Ramlibacter pinisoli TaxID=2682844 RepID=A0A6N8IM10_9BURK|nr:MULTISPECIES: hypothetical protein [Ramlibacter]MBA2960525.1 hypothetical protein [Ramlibacter sp. CGMCC 1.13660]MVQ27857.1 hypothetical protein [Ramlibacter pinisoli]